MNDDFTLTQDSQAVLLLCGELGKHVRDTAPLTLAQYNEFCLALNGQKKRPSDLLSLDEDLIEKVCATPSVNPRVKMPDKDRIVALLRRGLSLSSAVGRWGQCGIRVVSRADGNYPLRIKEYLKGRAPALLYFSGNADLFGGKGMAFVGSRDIDAESEEAIRTVVRGCVDLGMTVVSGGAKGSDATAMHEAFARGGKVIGALPCDLMKACLEPMNRDALADGRALLFSAHDPEARPFSYGAVAMERNKYIYATADGCFVAQSGVGPKSGTWSGAAEELKRENHHPVYVFLGKRPSPGCLDLQKRGAKAWDMEKSVAENLAKEAGMKTYVQDDLFGGFSAAEPVTPYERKGGTP